MKKRVVIVSAVILLVLVVMTITYSWFQWDSANQTNVNFDVHGLDDYLVYAKGEDRTVSAMTAVKNYNEGTFTSVTLYKSSLGADKTLYGHFYLDVTNIGTNLASEGALKWVLTLGDSNSADIISQGDFTSGSSSILLAKNLVLSSSLQNYTLWIYLDESELVNYELEGETLNTILKVEVTENMVS